MRSALLCLLLVCVLFSRTAGADQKQTVAVGVIGPMSGELAYEGQEMVRVLTLLGRELNSGAGKYDYRFIFEDGKCGTGSAATTAAKKLIEVDKVRFLITGCSGETLQAGPLAERAKVLTFAVVATHKDIRTLGPYIFRTYPWNIEGGMAEMADLMEREGLRRIALVNEEVSFTSNVKQVLTDRLRDKIVAAVDYPAGSADFRDLLLRVKAARPDAIYLSCAGPATCISLINQTREVGLRQPLFTYFFPRQLDVQQGIGRNGQGMRFLDLPDVAEVAPAFRNFTAAYSKEYGEPLVDFMTRTTYDAMQAIAAGIAFAGPDPVKILPFLATYKVQGALGTVAFDEYGEVRDLNYVIRTLAVP